MTDPGHHAAAAHGIERSPRWPGVRRAHLKQFPYCAFCPPPSRTTRLLAWLRLHRVEVHHILPFHFVVALGRPDLELDERNLATLCSGKRDHHLHFGHLDNFQTFNPLVREWAEHGGRHSAVRAPVTLGMMSDADKEDFRAMMDRMYPKVGTQGGAA